jgi:hypothetical protein
VKQGDSIASEGKGEYLFVEGRVLGTDGRPIPNAVIETWETDADGDCISSLAPIFFVANISTQVSTTPNIPIAAFLTVGVDFAPTRTASTRIGPLFPFRTLFLETCVPHFCESELDAWLTRFFFCRVPLVTC